MSNQPGLFVSKNTADFSSCRRYRYTLWRCWGDAANFVNFIGLNPSTADEIRDDQTIRRCVNFAKRWGYGAICMTNLFAFRATDPLEMKAALDPVGADNDKWLLTIAGSARLIVAAWGNHGDHLERDAEVMKLIQTGMHCLGETKTKQPKHPVRLRGDLVPLVYK